MQITSHGVKSKRLRKEQVRSPKQEKKKIKSIADPETIRNAVTQVAIEAAKASVLTMTEEKWPEQILHRLIQDR